MKRTLVIVLAAAAFGGCKKDTEKKPTPTPGSGTAAATPVEPPKARPSQQPQPTLPQLELPADEKRADRAKLGHSLFFDKRLSGANDRACYSCHMNEDGTGGHDPIAIGSGDKKLTRHAPTLWNVGFWKAYYWDGRAPTLEKNVQGAWGGGNMGGAPADAKPEEITAALDKRAADLAKLPGYKKLFEAAYPGTAEIKAEHVNRAIADYMRTLRCDDTAYDKYAAGDKNALTEQQQRGLDVFAGKGGCLVCHMAPYFSSAMAADNQFYNIGIGTKDVPEDKVDIGHMKVTKDPAHWAAFKPPSLRNVSKSAPYFHDGSVAKLEDAVKLMASGGIPNKNKHALVADRQLSEAERADVVAFLGGLECGGKIEEPAPLEGDGKGDGKGGGKGDGKGDGKSDGKGGAAKGAKGAKGAK
ncbi:MAG TPA: cytochrome c peroxidase [Kofleriaceae bacterium]|nr:cytochrome c peroxidase [Kofleriaceae bacterium]